MGQVDPGGFDSPPLRCSDHDFRADERVAVGLLEDGSLDPYTRAGEPPGVALRRAVDEATRAGELEAELRCIYDLMGRHLGKDLVPLPKDRDIDNEDLWLALDEAGFGRIVISPELVRMRIISALGEPAGPGGGEEDEDHQNSRDRF